MRTLLALLIMSAFAVAAPSTLLIEAESFEYTGGWVIDQQFADQMGSAFLLAHGMGAPVGDAHTAVTIPESGAYRVWVRTRDWVAQWNAPGAPGRFQVLANGKPLAPTFGTEGAKWHWQDGGTIRLAKGKLELTLHDLTGFEGRCDAVLLTTDTNLKPPDQGPVLMAFRRKTLGLAPAPTNAGAFDLVVIGGGMAGTSTAVSAARLGLKVALIQDRPILGGNTSSDIRVALGGAINLPPYPSIGVVVAELDPGKAGNAQPAANYDDERKLAVVKAEKNVKLFLNTRAYSVEKEGSRIKAVIARDVMTSRELRFSAPLFADCTGDGNIGFMAGADFRYGRESQSETGESMAPTTADKLVMGTSVMWYSEDAGRATTFPETPWALQFNEQSMQNATRGDWDWETGQNRHQIDDFEMIRDSAFRAIYGNWSYQKNHSARKDKFDNLRLSWVAYVGGKRESRRLMGDVILEQQDIVENRPFPDASVTATWSIDLHVPTEKISAQFPGEEFRSVASFGKKTPYAIPYRCFYSRNIENLFMAGRDISVTHVALGTVRVMRTTGMMGEVVGMAAAIATKHNTTPRGVYQSYLPELREAMTRGVGKAALAPRAAKIPAGYELAWSDEFDGGSVDATRWSYRTDSTDASTQLPRNVAVSDGGLILTMNRVSATGGSVYTGGGLTSKGTFGYGYYEARFRVLAGKGWHTSFRLLRENASVELGIVEADSSTADSYSAGATQDLAKQVKTLPLWDYHVFGCERTSKTVRYYLDGELVHTVAAGAEPAANVRIALSGIRSKANPAEKVDDSRLPGHVYCDYIRYYRPR
ncbi:MAG: FAD-dependent oxidoreductase [Acidobacteria bacterium]|nr:FAD-dependent oxidoreductase [Acidobacteriota bacterium]